MSKLIRLLKSPKEKDSPRVDEPQTTCSKCGKRPATDRDGLCNHCRFDAVISGMTEKE